MPVGRREDADAEVGELEEQLDAARVKFNELDAASAQAPPTIT